MDIQSLEEITGGEVSEHFYPLLVKVFESFPIGILLSKIINRMDWEESVVLFTTNELIELGFTKREFDISRGKLRDMGIITFKKGGKTETAYTVNFKILCSYINGESTIEKKSTVVSTKYLGELNTAFKNAGLTVPSFVGNTSYIKSLLSTYTSDEIALCWKDIKDCTFTNGANMKDFLSIGYLARNNVLDKWKEWMKNGRRNKSYTVRPGERPQDTKEFIGKTGSWSEL